MMEPKIWIEENIKKHLASDNRGVNVYYKKLGKRDCMMCNKKFDTYRYRKIIHRLPFYGV